MQKKDKEFDWNRMHPWYKMAYDHAQANQSYFELTADKPQFNLWLRYFQDRMMWAPAAFRQMLQIENPRQIWTAPCELPSWLPDFNSWASEQKRAGTLPKPPAIGEILRGSMKRAEGA